MNRKFVCIAAMLIVALLLFVSCENKTSVNETFTVTFDSDGGEAISPLSVTSGKIESESKTPTKEGYTFKGWSTTKDKKDLFDFNSPIICNITLTAIWEKTTMSETPDVPDTPDVPEIGTILVDEKSNLGFLVCDRNDRLFCGGMYNPTRI